MLALVGEDRLVGPLAIHWSRRGAAWDSWANWPGILLAAIGAVLFVLGASL